MRGITISEFMGSHLELLHQEGMIQVASSYRSALVHFMGFTKGVDVSLSEIDLEVIYAFRDYLLERKMDDNSVDYSVNAIRTIFDKAVEVKIIKNEYPFENLSIKTLVPNYEILSGSELRAIYNYDLSKNSALAFARDMFLLSFYLRGMSYYEMAKLSLSDIVDSKIEPKIETNGEVGIELESAMIEIIERYRGQVVKGDFLLPFYGENSDFSAVVPALNMRLRKLAKLLNLNVTLSSATARHSWAAMALNKGFSVRLISRCLGYKNDYFSQKWLDDIESIVASTVNQILIKNVRGEKL